MSQIELDPEIIDLLNKLKSPDETYNEVIRKLILAIDNQNLDQIQTISYDEFDIVAERILKKYNDILKQLAV